MAEQYHKSGEGIRAQEELQVPEEYEGVGEGGGYDG